MKKKPTQWRQGDVWIERLPDTTTLDGPKRKDAILAHGEVTGHSHTVELDGPEIDLDIREVRGIDEMLMRLLSPAKITHQEHGTIALEPGIYRVRRQREYSPAEIRRVAD